MERDKRFPDLPQREDHSLVVETVAGYQGRDLSDNIALTLA